MRRHRRRRYPCEWPTVFAVSFGLGLFLALLCSVRFALLLAAIALICLGVCRR